MLHGGGPLPVGHPLLQVCLQILDELAAPSGCPLRKTGAGQRRSLPVLVEGSRAHTPNVVTERHCRIPAPHASQLPGAPQPPTRLTRALPLAKRSKGTLHGPLYHAHGNMEQ